MTIPLALPPLGEAGPPTLLALNLPLPTSCAPLGGLRLLLPLALGGVTLLAFGVAFFSPMTIPLSIC